MINGARNQYDPIPDRIPESEPFKCLTDWGKPYSSRGLHRIDFREPHIEMCE